MVNQRERERHDADREAYRDSYNDWRHRTGRSSPKGSPEHLAKIAARRKPVWERFWAKVEFTDTCWLWTGALDKGGYGFFQNKRAHRMSYEWAKGPIPAGLQLDHLCFVRNCVYPDHLEPVTAKENTRRMRIRQASL